MGPRILSLHPARAISTVTGGGAFQFCVGGRVASPTSMIGDFLNDLARVRPSVSRRQSANGRLAPNLWTIV